MDTLSKAKAALAKREATIAEHQATIIDLQAAILQQEREAARWRMFLSLWNELSGSEPDPALKVDQVFVPTVTQEKPKGKRGPNGSAPDLIANAAHDVILAEGKPLSRSALIPLIEAKGLTIGGNDKAKNLGTLLWRSGKFGSTGEGYWPKGLPIPLQIKGGDVAEERRRDV